MKITRHLIISAAGDVRVVDRPADSVAGGD